MADAIDAPERRFVQNKYGKASVVSNLAQWGQIIFEVPSGIYPWSIILADKIFEVFMFLERPILF